MSLSVGVLPSQLCLQSPDSRHLSTGGGTQPPRSGQTLTGNRLWEVAILKVLMKKTSFFRVVTGLFLTILLKNHDCSHVLKWCLQRVCVCVCVCVYPLQAAGTAMSALIHALYETGNVGVARFIARKNATPRLVALLPQIKAAHEVIIPGANSIIPLSLVCVQCLVMLHLPFMEDIRQYTFPSLSGPSNTATPTGK